MSESIYDLVQKPEVVPPKGRLYKSIHPGKVTHKTTRSHAVFGPAKGVKIDPKEFTKKHSGHKPLPTPKKFSYKDQETRKPRPPTLRDEPPVQLQSSKNFIKENIITTTTMKPKPRTIAVGSTEDFIYWTEKRDFGKVPKYLDSVKSQVAKEYEIIDSVRREQMMEMSREPTLRKLTEEELEALREGLKANWESLYYEFMSGKLYVDVKTHVDRKSFVERKMAEIEKDLAKLEKDEVYVKI
ncbi:Enkurin like protein [Aduncisulcus paluster]|uniref:Enkurin like protein n=1 Tax=Aduncisulcus paluster TaxID=2918883 RepID=A0ABQ5KUL5_9EUKA|nr:Enkurin like protein [Aduncisulcus paluster]